MATLFWILLMLYPFVVYSQSGDDGETIDTDCWSLLSIQNSRLICVLDEEELDICEKFAKLCENIYSDCSNATMENNRFTFEKLNSLSEYILHIYLKGGRHQTKPFTLRKIVKITTPEIENATYKLDEAIIHIRYQHEFVDNPEFEVEFWGHHTSVKQKVTVKYKQLSIGGEKLRDSEIYSVHVRAKPVDYFDGRWTEWSKVKTFRVNNVAKKDAPSVLYILLCPVPIVLIVIVFLIHRWKKEIQTCIFPDVPGPKDTLAQIHRQNLHLPVSFSPEIFKDFNIYPVVYTEEKQFTPEFGDDLDDTTESCDEDVALKSSRTTSVCEKQVDDDQSLDSETSQLKLSDEHASAEDVHNNPGCRNVAALQRRSKDETYVTMSSLYKTQ